VRQGHYASEPDIDAIDPPPDLSIDNITRETLDDGTLRR